MNKQLKKKLSEQGWDGKSLRPCLSAYYYSFTPTGDEDIDQILEAVAFAGSAYHNTASWTDSLEGYAGLEDASVADIIQWAADAAAEAGQELRTAPQGSWCKCKEAGGEDDE